jgi:sulfur-oxidizing protein SoxY
MRAQFHLRRRRLLVGAFSGAVAGGVGQQAAAAPLPDEALAFAARNLSDAIAALGGVPQASGQITLEMPQVAENGALVPISVTSHLAGTREILIVVDGNPQPLAVSFTIPQGTEPYVATRIKMAQSGTVYAAVRTEEGLYATAHTTQVTVGGCA